MGELPFYFACFNLRHFAVFCASKLYQNVSEKNPPDQEDF